MLSLNWTIDRPSAFDTESTCVSISLLVTKAHFASSMGHGLTFVSHLMIPFSLDHRWESLLIFIPLPGLIVALVDVTY